MERLPRTLKSLKAMTTATGEVAVAVVVVVDA